MKNKLNLIIYSLILLSSLILTYFFFDFYNLGLLLWGFLVGLIVGISSIGTGLIGTPGLIEIFNIEPSISVGSMIIVGSLMNSSGAWQHIKNKNTNIPIAISFAIGSLPSSYLASFFSASISEILPLNKLIALVIILAILLLAYRYYFVKTRATGLEQIRITAKKYILSAFLGIFVGFLVGITGISGSILLIVLLILIKLPQNIAIGTTSIIATSSLLVASINVYRSARFDWHILVYMIIGSVCGASIGAILIDYIPQKITQAIILSLLAIVAISIFIR